MPRSMALTATDIRRDRGAGEFQRCVDRRRAAGHCERVPEQEPSPLTRWVVAHPTRWGASAGLAMEAIGLALFGVGAWVPLRSPVPCSDGSTSGAGVLAGRGTVGVTIFCVAPRGHRDGPYVPIFGVRLGGSATENDGDRR